MKQEIETLMKKLHAYPSLDEYNTAITYPKLYKKYGWEKCAEFLVQINNQAWFYNSILDDILTEFYSELYYILLNWSYNNFTEEEGIKLYKYLD